MVQGKRVAICLSGQPRFLDRCWPSIKRHLVAPLEADIFGHFWCSVSKLSIDQLLYTSDASKFVQYIKLNPDILKQFNYVVYEPQLYFDQSLYKSSCTEENSRMQSKSFQGVLSMHYSIWRADQIRQIYEADKGRYDLIIRCRTDMEWHQEPNWDEILHLSKFGIITPDHETYGCVNDQVAFGTSRDIGEYSLCYFNIPALFRAGTNFHPETILRDHLKNRGVNWNQIPIKYKLTKE